jgi:hypothetical protein
MATTFTIAVGVVSAALALSSVCVAAEGTGDTAAMKVLKQMLQRYGGAQSYRASGTVVEFQSLDKRVVENAQTFELVFVRSSGIKLVVHAKHRDGSAADSVAWGPPDDVQFYGEHLRYGFIEFTESPDPKMHYATRFNQLVSFTYTNPGDIIGGMLIDGKLPLVAAQTSWSMEQQAGARSLLQSEPVRPQWRRFTVEPDGTLIRVVVPATRDTGQWTTDIRIAHQTFGAPVTAKELSYTMPDYARAFDIRLAVDPNEKKAAFDRLAQAGSKDGQVQQLLYGLLKPEQTPDAAVFRLMMQRLEQAETLGYLQAYRWHAEMLQPDNRNWFPPELAKLSDAEVYARQRALLWQGATHCAGDSAGALRTVVHPSLSASELEKLKAVEATCEERWRPPEVRKAQAELDRAQMNP